MAIDSSVRLDGTVALVTGGGRGLGQAFAQALAAAGASVAVTARSADQLEETVRMIREAGGRAIGLPGDVTDPAAVESVVATAQQQLGPIDLLVNNAGIPGPMVATWQADREHWWQTVEVNLRGPYLFTSMVLPSMMDRRHGRIINITSGAAAGPSTYLSAYGAAKAGLTHWTNTLAVELSDYGIVLFSYAPGMVRTSMVEYAVNSPEVDERIQSRFRNNLEAGRDTPIELTVERFMFLASGQADSLSGRMIRVSDDPGELLRRAEEIKEADLYTLRLRT
jgi:NAD(P)-dependent dehydrogenase (short-subunit alcohol dehydrogenase family)